MKYLLLALILVSTLATADDTKVSYITGGWSHHLFDHDDYNDTHNINGLGVETENYYAQAVQFKNSFYYDAYSVAAGKKFGSFVVGAAISTGYDKVGLNNVGRFAVAPAFMYAPDTLKALRINLVGNALFADVAIPLN